MNSLRHNDRRLAEHRRVQPARRLIRKWSAVKLCCRAVGRGARAMSTCLSRVGRRWRRESEAVVRNVAAMFRELSRRADATVSCQVQRTVSPAD